MWLLGAQILELTDLGLNFDSAHICVILSKLFMHSVSQCSLPYNNVNDNHFTDIL
jgi:hypothetical protein